MSSNSPSASDHFHIIGVGVYNATREWTAREFHGRYPSIVVSNKPL